MTAYQNNFLIEVEEYFGALLTDDGLTNDQALVLVKKQYGEHGHEYVCDLIKKEVHIHKTTIHKKPSALVKYYRKFVEWLKCF